MDPYLYLTILRALVPNTDGNSWSLIKRSFAFFNRCSNYFTVAFDFSETRSNNSYTMICSALAMLIAISVTVVLTRLASPSTSQYSCESGPRLLLKSYIVSVYDSIGSKKLGRRHGIKIGWYFFVLFILGNYMSPQGSIVALLGIPQRMMSGMRHIHSIIIYASQKVSCAPLGRLRDCLQCITAKSSPSPSPNPAFLHCAARQKQYELALYFIQSIMFCLMIAYIVARTSTSRNSASDSQHPSLKNVRGHAEAPHVRPESQSPVNVKPLNLCLYHAENKAFVTCASEGSVLARTRQQTCEREEDGKRADIQVSRGRTTLVRTIGIRERTGISGFSVRLCRSFSLVTLLI